MDSVIHLFTGVSSKNSVSPGWTTRKKIVLLPDLQFPIQMVEVTLIMEMVIIVYVETTLIPAVEKEMAKGIVVIINLIGIPMVDLIMMVNFS